MVGFKPPYGRVPQDPPFNLDHYCHDGPMARTVEDCRLLENVMAGPHRDDIVSLRPKLTIPADLPGVEGLRIAASADLGGFEASAEVRENLRAAAGVFRSLGAAVDEVALALDMGDLRDAARAHFAAIFGSLIRRSLARHRDLMTTYAIAFAEDAGEPNVGYYRSLEIESEVYAQVADVLDDHDLLITPVFGVPALKATAAEYDIQGIAIETNILQDAQRLVPQVFMHAALNDSEQRIAIAIMGVLTALRPTQRKPHRRGRVALVRGIRCAFVENHDNIGIERALNTHRFFRRQEADVPVYRRTKPDPFLADLAQLTQTENLESAGVGENRPIPAHEAMQSTMRCNDVEARSEPKVECIAEHDLCTDGMQRMVDCIASWAGIGHSHELRRKFTVFVWVSCARSARKDSFVRR